MSSSNYSRILCEQQRVIKLTRERAPMLFRLAEDGIEALLRTHDVVLRSQQGNEMSADAADEFFAASFTSVASSFVSSVELIEKGFYAQAAVVNRSLLDTLIVVHYLRKQPGRGGAALRWIDGGPSRLRALYETIVPGVYDKRYRPLANLYRWAGTLGMKVKEDSEESKNESACPSFNDELCQSLVNDLLMLLLGFLRLHRVRPPGGPFVIRNPEQGEINLDQFFSDRVDVADADAVWRLLTRPDRKPVLAEPTRYNRQRRFVLF